MEVTIPNLGPGVNAMRLRSLALLTASLALAGTALTGTGPAAADDDTTPPAVTIEPDARLLVGSQVFTYVEGEDLQVWEADFQVRWKASDPSGICGQTLVYSNYDTIGGDPDPRFGGAPTEELPIGADDRTWVERVDSFDWGRGPDRWLVEVTDCAGNTADTAVAASEFGFHDDTDPVVRYRGAWRVATADGASGGSTHATSARGASARVRFPGDDTPLSLVMKTGPRQGRVDVYVDGRRRGTIDTHSAVPRHRVVVWSQPYRPGMHTLRLVNRGTAGHPRIDLDAVVFCDGTPAQIDCLGSL